MWENIQSNAFVPPKEEESWASSGHNLRMSSRKDMRVLRAARSKIKNKRVKNIGKE